MPDILIEVDWDILLLQIKNGNSAPSLGSGEFSTELKTRWEAFNRGI